MKKDLEWLKREVLDNKFMGHTIHIDVLFELMDELDEPEVLSQEWIDYNKCILHAHDYIIEYISTDNLQNLLVPKQELPVIPQFVADAIENDNHVYTYGFLQTITKDSEKHRKVWEWAENEDGKGRGSWDELAKAHLIGYEVEELEE